MSRSQNIRFDVPVTASSQDDRVWTGSTSCLGTFPGGSNMLSRGRDAAFREGIEGVVYDAIHEAIASMANRAVGRCL